MDNTSVFRLIFGLSGHNLFWDRVMLFGAEYLIYVAMVLVFTLAIKGGRQERKAMLLALISIPIVVFLIKFIHLFFFEPRPYVAQNFTPLTYFKNDASFPSRHASIISIIAFSYLFYKSKWFYLFLVFLFVIGISRIYTGVHYPLDILGGFALGIVSLMISKQIIRLLKGKLAFS